VNRQRLLTTFLRLAQVDSPSHAETNLAQLLTREFAELGWQVHADSSGNLIASLAGDSQRAPLLFASHMDVVMPCLGVRPKVTDGVIHSSGETVLGADAKASIAAMLEAAAALPGNHPPIEFVFTVGEEVGHLGAKALDISALKAEQAWVLDGLVPVGTIIIGAPTYYSFVAKVHGRAAHAGVEPERGISAIAVAAEAIAQLQWGRLDTTTTANIGTIRGGSVRNAVPAELERNSAELDFQSDYWDGGYRSYPNTGDRYYDDKSWVGSDLTGLLVGGPVVSDSGVRHDPITALLGDEPSADFAADRQLLVVNGVVARRHDLRVERHLNDHVGERLRHEGEHSWIVVAQVVAPEERVIHAATIEARDSAFEVSDGATE